MTNFVTPGLQHTRLPYPSLSPGICSDSCPLSRWHHPTISSFVTLFSFAFNLSGGWTKRPLDKLSYKLPTLFWFPICFSCSELGYIKTFTINHVTYSENKSQKGHALFRISILENFILGEIWIACDPSPVAWSHLHLRLSKVIINSLLSSFSSSSHQVLFL